MPRQTLPLKPTWRDRVRWKCKLQKLSEEVYGKGGKPSLEVKDS